MFVSLKPLGERTAQRRPGDRAAARQARAACPGATLFLQAVQDIRIGGRASSAQYQYTLQGDNLDELNDWAPQVLEQAARRCPQLADVNSDQQNQRPAGVARRSTATPRRGWASRRRSIDNTLYDAFGQRQVSTMYTPLNQYHVVHGGRPAVLAEPRRRCSYIYVARQQRRAGAAERVHALRADHDAAGGQPPGPVPVGHDLVQPAARRRRSATPSTRSSRPSARSACRPASTAASGHRAGVSGVAGQRADPDPGRAGHGLHRARHPLRELHPPDHDPLHAALGRRRRAAGAAAVPAPS